jgi:hypothetical protein
MITEDKIHKLKEFIINHIVSQHSVYIRKGGHPKYSLYHRNPILFSSNEQLNYIYKLRSTAKEFLRKWRDTVYESERNDINHYLINIYNVSLSTEKIIRLIFEIKKRIYEKYLSPAYEDLTTNY